MDFKKLEENKCRVCLDDNVELEWNDYIHDNLTYKDCYYKYTHLECFDGDDLYLSTMLCRNCSSTLDNINAFVSKAIETHRFLQESLALCLSKGEDEQNPKANFETVLLSEMDIKPDVQDLPMSEDSTKECLKEESDAWSLSEDTTKAMEKPRRKRKRRSIKKENQNEETQDEKKEYKKNYHCSKPWEIPTCCTICSKVLASKYKAIEHEKIHVENRERNEVCEECGMRFYNTASLRSHMLTHLKNREKSRKCEFCDKAFYNTGGLNIHRRIHLGQMIQCSLCDKEYYRQIDLDKHMISHSATRISGELKPKKKYFVCCEICGENIRSASYKEHTARHMNKPLAKCAICEKEFFSRNSCVSHVKKFHKKPSGDRTNFVISYKTTRYSNLFLQQNVGKIFTKE